MSSYLTNTQPRVGIGAQAKALDDMQSVIAKFKLEFLLLAFLECEWTADEVRHVQS